jgi:hypothetical protein
MSEFITLSKFVAITALVMFVGQVLTYNTSLYKGQLKMPDFPQPTNDVNGVFYNQTQLDAWRSDAIDVSRRERDLFIFQLIVVFIIYLAYTYYIKDKPEDNVRVHPQHVRQNQLPVCQNQLPARQNQLLSVRIHPDPIVMKDIDVKNIE